MSKELPGFYYDEEKNRYFPIRGPIPGSSRKRKSKPSASLSSLSAVNSGKSASESHQASKTQDSIGSKLLQFRELCGNIIPCRKGRLNFQTEYQNKLASQPLVWKYELTKKKVEYCIEQINVDVDMPDGAMETDVLLTGGPNRELSLFQVGKVGLEFHYDKNCMAKRVWPVSNGQQPENTIPRDLWMPICSSIFMPSDISCIKTLQQPNDGHLSKKVLVTTMGAGASYAIAYIMDLTAALGGHTSRTPVLKECVSFESTFWTADCNRDGSKAVIGTNLGVFHVNVPCGVSSHILRSDSDVLSLQLDNSGNMILCGLRNGTIVRVDARQKNQEFSYQHQYPYAYRAYSGSKFRRNVHPSFKTFMPSSVSCLTMLMLYDQYFLASSMDGSMKLYDQRLMQKGAVQSYEGNVNSHTRIQHGVDPSERVVMSGGEDCKLRLWNIKSGKLIFEDQFMHSVPSALCWPRSGDLAGTQSALLDDREYWQNHQMGAWLGSREGLFYMEWC